jgi:hypothetical protein
MAFRDAKDGMPTVERLPLPVKARHGKLVRRLIVRERRASTETGLIRLKRHFKGSTGSSSLFTPD